MKGKAGVVAGWGKLDRGDRGLGKPDRGGGGGGGGCEMGVAEWSRRRDGDGDGKDSVCERGWWMVGWMMWVVVVVLGRV